MINVYVLGLFVAAIGYLSDNQIVVGTGVLIMIFGGVIGRWKP